MDTHDSEPRLHPLMMAAAISIIIFCGVGVAALSGLLPMSKTEAAAETVGNQSSSTPETPVVQVAAPAPAADIPLPAPEPALVPSKPKRQAASDPKAATCYSCGTVIAVNAVTVQGDNSGIGAVGGAVVGGVVGHQFGKGNGKKAMTALGAIGGALTGNQIEKSQRQSVRYDVVVRLQDGSTQTVSDSTPPPFSSGDKVRLENGTLTHTY